MIFRSRGNVVQIVRSAAASSSGSREEVIAQLDKRNPQLDDSSRKACSAEELARIDAWISRRLSAAASPSSGSRRRREPAEGGSDTLDALGRSIERTASRLRRLKPGTTPSAQGSLLLDQVEGLREALVRSLEPPPAVAVPQSVAPDLGELRNSGVLCLNDDGAVPPERTVVVLGAARGGTSMIASVLDALGVFMGSALSAVYEDVEMARAMEAGDTASVAAVVEARNAAHAVWGFKRPSAAHYIQTYESQLRHPRYVVVFRDIFAIANRNRISTSADVRASLDDALVSYQQLVDFVGSTGAPVLLVSYEKMIAKVEACVARIAAFVGVDDPDRLAAAVARVEPEPADYLDQSRSRRGLGRIDQASNRRVRGWAVMLGSADPVQVSLRVNGREVAVLPATVPRPDLVEQKRHPTGLCGFDHSFVPPLADGDEVSVRIVGEVFDLRHSPWRVGPRQPRT
jgi:hypothetical protein